MPTTDKYLDQAIMQRLSYIVQTLFKKEQILSAYSADLRMDDNFVLTFSLYNREGEAILNKSIDLPLEDMIIDGWYDEETKKIVLVLKSGTRIEFSVADLVSGLQSEITPENKLNSDLVSDVNQVHKFTTFADIQKLAGIEPGAQVNLPPVETEMGELKVHKIDKAEPLITIEGVDYYHKYEFDLENLNENLGVEGVSCVNLLTGEIYNDDDNTAYISTHTNGGNTKGLKLYLAKSSPFNIDIYKGTLYGNVTYTSCAFTVVQTRNQVNNINKICLPGCTNYYGWLSEDGNTFISYWNEEADLLINPITKITDGINTIDIHDSRLPNAGTEGKFLKDNFTWDTVDALPDRTSAQVNDVLKLDNNKEPVWSAEEKELPSTVSAEQGQVLTLNSSKEPEWDSISAGVEVIELNSISGTLTNEQIELIKSDNCVIKYDIYIFYKGDWSGNDQWYSYYTPKLYVSASADMKNIGNYYVNIDTNTKEYAINGVIGAQIERVKANQSLSGSEINLTSLKIGSTNYKISNETLIETTHANLKSLRDTSQLKPGMWYRITDYRCTTTQANTLSADHQFDIIVRADSINKINENAYAIQHAGDTYFASNKLEAWQLWYCLDNDTTRFAWADSTNGRGVIYRMIDEFNNDVPYDFKNILFTKSGSYTNAYTFTYTENSTIKDASLLGRSKFCYGNIMKESYQVASGSSLYKQALNFNVFYSTNNHMGCLFNTFGNGCTFNTFANNCHCNTFGNYCNSNTFDDNCQYNTLGNYCYLNIFGSCCYSNTFGSCCQSNIFGRYYYNNTFGNDCSSNTFGDGSSWAIDYVQHIIMDNGCQNLYINSTDTSVSDSNYLQNVHIHLGLKGTAPSNRKTITINRNLSYTTEVWPTGTVNMMIE